MVHTLQIYSEVTDIVSFLSSFGISNKKISQWLNDSKRPIHIRKSFPIGFMEIFVFSSRLQFGTSFYIFIKLEPQRLLEGKATLKLFNPSTINTFALLTKFYNSMYFYLINYPDLHYLSYLYNYRVRRIDYTKDFTTLYVHELLALLPKNSKKNNRCKLSNGLKKKTYDNYYQCSKAITTTLYDKLNEINEKFTASEKACIGSTPDILRLEIHLKKSAVSYRCKKYNIKNNAFQFLISSKKISQEMLESKYRKIIGTGNFYKAYSANKIINDSSFSLAIKKRLTAFLKDLSSNSMKKYSSPTVRSYTAKLEELGIAPIIIPKNWKCPSCIPNPAKNLEFM